MEKKLWDMMDRFFILLMALSGEEKYDDININHIL